MGQFRLAPFFLPWEVRLMEGGDAAAPENT